MLLHQFIHQAAQNFPEKTAVICGEESLTYSQLAAKMDSWATKLMGFGIKRGDRVGLLMYNGLNLVQLYYACFRVGAIAVPFNTRYQEPELAYAVNQSGSSILMAGREFTPVVKNIRKDAPGLGGLFIMDETLEEVFAKPGLRRDTAISELPEVAIADPAFIIYTSGSTGKPKGVIHTHYSLFHHIENKTKSLEINGETVGLAGTQICHCAGCFGILLPVLANGGTCVMLQEFESGAYIAHLQKYQPMLLVLMPTQLLEILEHPRAQDADFSRTSSMLIGGDTVPHHTYDLFRSLAGFDLSEGCGMTECEGYCVQPTHGVKKPGSIGKPIAGIKMRLVDPDGNELPDNQVGEIQVMAESVTAGYWDKPEETAKAFVDGWLRTGDLAFRDEDGYYHFVGRIKEIIIRGGSNIMPGEVEDVLDDHPLVELSGVVGFPDAHYGSIVGAFIMPRDPAKPPTPEELTNFAAERLARYKLPEKWIFVDHIPQTASGKIDRKQLHVLAAEYAKKGE